MKYLVVEEMYVAIIAHFDERKTTCNLDIYSYISFSFKLNNLSP